MLLSIPLIVYNIPQNTGSIIDLETLLILSEYEGIVGTKHGSDNFSSYCRVLLSRNREGFACLQRDGLGQYRGNQRCNRALWARRMYHENRLSNCDFRPYGAHPGHLGSPGMLT